MIGKVGEWTRARWSVSHSGGTASVSPCCGARWPTWVYAEGEEPDYRFSFANERTFLAWIRTSLAMLAAAGAVDLLALDMAGLTRDVLAGFLVALGMFSAVVAWIRWAAAERAIRRRRPLPSFGYALLITAGLVVAGGVIMVGVFYP